VTPSKWHFHKLKRVIKIRRQVHIKASRCVLHLIQQTQFYSSECFFESAQGTKYASNTIYILWRTAQPATVLLLRGRSVSPRITVKDTGTAVRNLAANVIAWTVQGSYFAPRQP
jgi:hypothetical protein